MDSNEEVNIARQDLKNQRKKLEEMTRDLNSSEVRERQLEEKSRSVEQMCKPPLLRYSDALEELSLDCLVGQSLLEEVAGDEWKNVMEITRSRIATSESLSRFETLMIFKILFRLHAIYAEKDVPEALSALDKLSISLVRHLGTPGQSWDRLSTVEVESLQMVVKHVSGIPPFLRRLLESLLSHHMDSRQILMEATTQTMGSAVSTSRLLSKPCDHGTSTRRSSL